MKIVIEILLDEAQWKNHEEKLKLVENDIRKAADSQFESTFWYRDNLHFRPDFEVISRIEND